MLLPAVPELYWASPCPPRQRKGENHVKRPKNLMNHLEFARDQVDDLLYHNNGSREATAQIVDVSLPGTELLLLVAKVPNRHGKVGGQDEQRGPHHVRPNGDDPVTSYSGISALWIVRSLGHVKPHAILESWDDPDCPTDSRSYLLDICCCGVSLASLIGSTNSTILRAEVALGQVSSMQVLLLSRELHSDL